MMHATVLSISTVLENIDCLGGETLVIVHLLEVVMLGHIQAASCSHVFHHHVRFPATSQHLLLHSFIKPLS